MIDLNKIEHKWIKDEKIDEWFIECVEYKKRFQPTALKYRDEGTCSFCGKNAGEELIIRKEIRRIEEERRSKEKKIKINKKGQAYLEQEFW